MAPPESRESEHAELTRLVVSASPDARSTSICAARFTARARVQAQLSAAITDDNVDGTSREPERLACKEPRYRNTVRKERESRKTSQSSDVRPPAGRNGSQLCVGGRMRRLAKR